MSPEEEQIWKSIQLKDKQVFESYYKENYKFFFLAACKYLGDPALAQEAVNDVFLRIWEDAGKLVIRTSPRSYLYRSVVNRCYNMLKLRKREVQQQAEVARQLDDVTEWKDMEDNELKLRLFAAIDELPEQCRKVFRMSRYETLKQQEIADQLGISIKTVKNHITHALKALQRVLDDWNALAMGLAAMSYIFSHAH
ncbi:MAG TPA: RNA polymerase sigma-70 factor [Puia sp.]|nr:RNA polymerase sigma-70 factor [Puia sp.]